MHPRWPEEIKDDSDHVASMLFPLSVITRTATTLSIVHFTTTTALFFRRHITRDVWCVLAKPGDSSPTNSRAHRLFTYFACIYHKSASTTSLSYDNDSKFLSKCSKTCYTLFETTLTVSSPLRATSGNSSWSLCKFSTRGQPLIEIHTLAVVEMGIALNANSAMSIVLP
jgi:hypothetical protein